MFVPRTFNTMRLVAMIAVIALITLVTAFDYEASGLPFVDNAEPSSQDQAVAPMSLAMDPVGEFIAPVEIIDRTGDARFFVVSLMGHVAASDGVTQTVVLDISDLTVIEGERGLLGATFSPDGSLLYMHYSNLAGDSVVAEYQVDPTTAIADPASARVLLTIGQPFDNHNGGEIAFGPDGYLYVGVGDGGLANDPNRTALDLSSRLGKILRIDPTPSGGNAYTVPTDNPFFATPGADPTIWSYGLRNPWKFSFDPATNDLWIADVGQNMWEEINFAPSIDGAAGRGLSFGWSAYEGDARFNEDQVADGHTAPFATYERAEGLCSISGGAVYRGTNNPGLDGWYIYGDYCTGQIFAIDTADANSEILTLGQLDALVAIAAGPGGELYAASVAGPVFKLT